MESTTGVAALSDNEVQQIERANDTGLQPVVFAHGLWLLPNSWERWATFFEEQRYVAVAPGWPDDPETVDAAKKYLEAFANKTVGQIADSMLIVAADQDHPVPVSVAKGAFKLQQRNAGLTEMVEMHDRGHALTIDQGWRDVAKRAPNFIRRFV